MLVWLNELIIHVFFFLINQTINNITDWLKIEETSYQNIRRVVKTNTLPVILNAELGDQSIAYPLSEDILYFR